MSHAVDLRYADNSWMRPLLPNPGAGDGGAFAEETVQGLRLAGERSVNWFLDDTPAGEDALARIMRGEACNWCLQPFPAKVGLADLAVWRRNLQHFKHMDGERIMRLVAQGCCPMCAKPVGESIAEADHLGSDPGKGSIEDRAADFFEGGDARAAKRAHRDSWVRGRRKNRKGR